MYASIHNHIDIVEMLCINNANLNIQNKNGATALILASSFGFVDIVKTLCKYHANANIKDN